MRKYIFTLILITLFLAGQAQPLHWINPSTGFNQINDIHFVSAGEGFAVGNQGKILHYLNGEWSLMESPVNTDLFGVSFAGPDMGWAVGDNGTILRYQNGSWTQFTSPITGMLRDICCISENLCRAAGDAILVFDGSEWQIEAGISGCETIAFLNENLGWAGNGSKNLHKFENGTWSEDGSFYSGEDFFINTLEKAGDYMLLNGKTIPGEGVMFENNGNGWEEVQAGSCNSGISFTGREYGFGLQNAGPMSFDLHPTVHQFTDGQWQTVFVHDKPFQSFTALEATGNDACMASDNLGYIHKIEDGSHSIANGFMYDSILDLQFVKPNLGFLAARNSGLWKYDAGEWENIFNFPGYTIHIIDFPNENQGCFGAYKQYDYYPFWPDSKLFTYKNGEVSEIPFPDENSFISSLNYVGTDLVFTQRNTIFTFADGQITTESIAFPDSISDLKFMMPAESGSNNRNSSWEAAWMSVKRHDNPENGVILYKTPEGSNWQEVYATGNGIFNNLCIFGLNRVVAVGTNGLIAVFDGSNWSELQPITGDELLSVHLNENMNGWAVGRNGTLLQCTSGNWSVYEIGITFDLNVVSFYDNTLGFIGGNHGALLCTAGTIPVPNTYFPVSGNKNSLKVFPNPTRETFTLEFDSPAANARIIFTDPAGRLLMEKRLLTPGSGKQLVTLPASGLGTGIYLLTLISDSGISTAKLVVK